MSERTGRVQGWVVGLACIAAVVAIAVGWSAIRRAERAQQRVELLEGVIKKKDAEIVTLQKGASGALGGETGGPAEVGGSGE